MNISKFFIATFLFFIINGCTNSKKVTQDDLDKNSQFFQISNSKYCRDPWSEGNIVELLGLLPSKDKYGESSILIQGWVKFRMKLVVPPAGKQYAHLEIPFTYFSVNCWSDEYRDGSINYNGSSSPLLDEIVAHSDLGEGYLKNAKDGEIFYVYVENPEFNRKTPSDACDVTYVDIKSSSRVLFFKEMQVEKIKNKVTINTDVIKNDTSTQSIEKNNTENSFQVGNSYFVNASEQNKVHFYKSPKLSDIKASYFTSKELIKINDIRNGFAFIIFENDRKQKSMGWIKLADLSFD